MDNFTKLIDKESYTNVIFGDGSEAREYETIFKVIIDNMFYVVVKPLNPVSSEEEEGAFVLYLNEKDHSITQVQDPDLLTDIFDTMVEDDFIEDEE